MINKSYDIVVIGGGVSGLCSALASARLGAKVALVHARPVLGGNASSEIRMHICGADCHGERANARETGIVEELQLSNKFNNSQHSFSMQDLAFFDICVREKNLSLYLNTSVIDVEVENGSITSVTAFQQTTEQNIKFNAKYFVDATGDGFVASKAGANYFVGRESRDTYYEAHAPIVADDKVMGNSLMFTYKDMGCEQKFVKPIWARTYTEDQLKNRVHIDKSGGYWWIELGSDIDGVLHDSENTNKELLSVVLGVWEHLKNSDHGLSNYCIDWIGFFPARRESRRIEGDYILTENDLTRIKFHYDDVAYGGWSIDEHVGMNMDNLEGKPNFHIHLAEPYGIPYRSLYSKDIDNLFLAGRAISVSHMAFCSTRVMATCGVVGEAVGTACAYALKYNETNRGMLKHITKLQKQLIKQDCYIPNLKNEDCSKHIKNVECYSFSDNNFCQNILDGFSRSTEKNTHYYESLSVSNNEFISVDVDEKEYESLVLKFDSNLSAEQTITISSYVANKQQSFPNTIVKDYDVELFLQGKIVKNLKIRDNILRYNKININKKVDKIKIKFLSTHGYIKFRLYELFLV